MCTFLYEYIYKIPVESECNLHYLLFALLHKNYITKPYKTFADKAIMYVTYIYYAWFNTKDGPHLIVQAELNHLKSITSRKSLLCTSTMTHNVCHLTLQ